MGRKEISQMTFFNFVSAIAIGSIAGSFVITPQLSIHNGVIALVGWAAFTIFMGILDIKSKQARKTIAGDPLILIQDGNIIETALQKSRLDMDALSALLRQKNIFSVADVHYAIFETNGTLSVLPKEGAQPLTKSDVQLVTKEKTHFPLATQVISDGNIVKENLTKLNLDQSWLTDQLQKVGVDSINDVFYAEVQQDGNLHIDEKDRIIH